MTDTIRGLVGLVVILAGLHEPETECPPQVDCAAIVVFSEPQTSRLRVRLPLPRSCTSAARRRDERARAVPRRARDWPARAIRKRLTGTHGALPWLPHGSRRNGCGRLNAQAPPTLRARQSFAGMGGRAVPNRRAHVHYREQPMNNVVYLRDSPPARGTPRGTSANRSAVTGWRAHRLLFPEGFQVNAVIKKDSLPAQMNEGATLLQVIQNVAQNPQDIERWKRLMA